MAESDVGRPHASPTRKRPSGQKHPRWTAEENEQLVALVKQRGHDWVYVSSALGTGRTPQAVMQHHKVVVSKGEGKTPVKAEVKTPRKTPTRSPAKKKTVEASSAAPAAPAAAAPAVSTSASLPTQEALLAQWRSTLQDGPMYEKFGPVHARLANEPGMLDTYHGDAWETRRTYGEGDFLVMGAEGEEYAVEAKTFAMRYDIEGAKEATDDDLRRDGYKLFTPTGKVWARQMSEAEIEQYFPLRKFVARWGEEMVINPCDYLAMPAPGADEVYRIESSSFGKTYRLLETPSTPGAADEMAPVRSKLALTAKLLCIAGVLVAALAVGVKLLTAEEESTNTTAPA